VTFTTDYIRQIKREQDRGRCLHYDRGGRCNNIIDAHSIQRRGQLQEIEENGHVYQFSTELSILRKTDGMSAPRKVGWNRATTFAGFCKRHDNELFKPIDEKPLLPNAEQVSLYAYRCLCREFFVKENAVKVFSAVKDHVGVDPHERKMLRSALIGNGLGFEQLLPHKERFDEALRARAFGDFDFVTFTSTSPWSLQLSGVLYPDHDFIGERIQNLGGDNTPWSLITFFTAPFSTGWTFTLCWHVSSRGACEHFARSLASLAHSGGSLEDALLRFSISCCENHAIRVSWWDGLAPEHQRAIVERVALMAAPHISVPAWYLARGLDGIADWRFENVYTSLPTGT
jgi:hypothetical protein